MRRAALLPTPGDPFLVAYWLRNFRVWRREVDVLRVLVNGQADCHALDLIAAEVAAAGGEFDWLPEMTDHGVLLGELIDGCDADTVLLVEDDAYVRNPQMVAACFQRIERGEVEVVGSPRGCASAFLLERAERRWPELPATGTEDTGHALWPSFLFARRETLLATDRNFGAQSWQAGELVPGLRARAPEPVSADTFVATSYQLRDRRVPIALVPQYRLSQPAFFRSWQLGAPWFHVGSLSSGYGYAFANDAGAIRLVDDRTTPVSEWARRLSWWERFLRTAGGELPEHQERYRAALDELYERTGATRDLVDRWTRLYDPFVTWPECE